MEKPTYEEWCEQNPLTIEENQALAEHVERKAKQILDGAEKENIAYSAEQRQYLRKRIEMITKVFIVQTRGVYKLDLLKCM